MFGIVRCEGTCAEERPIPLELFKVYTTMPILLASQARGFLPPAILPNVD